MALDVNDVRDSRGERAYRYWFGPRMEAYVVDLIRRPERIHVGDLDDVLDLRDDGVVSRAEFHSMFLLDGIFRGRAGRGEDAPERFVALRFARVLSEEEVDGAAAGAAILRLSGLDAVAAVAAEVVSDAIAARARERGVTILEAVQEPV
jgi:hypothetical protein